MFMSFIIIIDLSLIYYSSSKITIDFTIGIYLPKLKIEGEINHCSLTYTPWIFEDPNNNTQQKPIQIDKLVISKGSTEKTKIVNIVYKKNLAPASPVASNPTTPDSSTLLTTPAHNRALTYNLPERSSSAIPAAKYNSDYIEKIYPDSNQYECLKAVLGLQEQGNEWVYNKNEECNEKKLEKRLEECSILKESTKYQQLFTVTQSRRKIFK
jgi:hypothetical protein